MEVLWTCVSSPTDRFLDVEWLGGMISLWITFLKASSLETVAPPLFRCFCFLLFPTLISAGPQFRSQQDRATIDFSGGTLGTWGALAVTCLSQASVL